jgi:hypothetical protein
MYNPPVAYKLLQIPSRDSHFHYTTALVCVHGSILQTLFRTGAEPRKKRNLHALNTAGRRLYNWHHGAKCKAADGFGVIEEQSMKVFLVLGWSLMAAAAAMPAAAAPFAFGNDYRPFVQNQPSRPGPQRETDRPVPQRDTRAPGGADRGRMNPDERRQLRRDIQDAGRDIYHRDRQPPPRRSGRR